MPPVETKNIHKIGGGRGGLDKYWFLDITITARMAITTPNRMPIHKPSVEVDPDAPEEGHMNGHNASNKCEDSQTLHDAFRQNV